MVAESQDRMPDPASWPTESQDQIPSDSEMQEEEKEEEKEEEEEEEIDDDEPDEWDKRIIKTGCSEENFKLQMCYADTRDWRQCLKEMEEFKKCWSAQGNNERTSTKDY